MEVGRVATNTIVEQDTEPGSDTLPLVKVHGSINWYYCDSCHDVRVFDLPRLKALFEKDEASYAVIGICKRCGGQRRPLLIPPMGLKIFVFPDLIRLWDTARDQIAKAQYLVAVGYSFSEADAYINKIIERSMTRNENQRIIVCDPDPQLVLSLRARFSARIDKFNDRRVLAAIGKSHDTLPRFLESMVSPKEKATATAEALVAVAQTEGGRDKPIIVTSEAEGAGTGQGIARPH